MGEDQCVDPLLAVLGVFPSGHPINMNLFRHIFECWDFEGGIKAGVQPLLCHPPIFERAFSGLVERHNICTAQTKIRAQRRSLPILLAFYDNAHNPPART